MGMIATEMSAKLVIASSTANESVARGRRIVEEQDLEFIEEEIKNPR